VTRRQRQANLSALLVGLIATGVVLLTYGLGGLDWLELTTLDLRFIYANSIRAHPDIVHIDIDDRTLELVGRWPWPRDKQAALVSIPLEVGVKALLVDLTWVEQEPWRTVAPPGGGILWDPLELAVQQNPEIAFPDYELRAAMARAENVYVACHYPEHDLERSPGFEAIVDALLDGDQQEARRRALQLETERARHIKDDREKRKDPLARARIVAALQAAPGLNAAATAEQLGLPRASVVEAFERCRQAAFRRAIRIWLDEQPDRWQRDPWNLVRGLHTHLAGPGQSFADDTEVKAVLAVALHEVLGYEATTRAQLVPLERVTSVAEPLEAIVPVNYLLARAAKRCGFVTFKPDHDGIMRREALFARHGDRVLTQLAFGLACDLLGVTAADIVVKPNRLVLRPHGTETAPLVIQLDDHGRTLVPWVPPGGESDGAAAQSQTSVEHRSARIPAAMIWQVHDRRRLIAENKRAIRDTLERVLSSDYFGDAEEYARQLHEMKLLQAELRNARYHGLAGAIAELEPRLAALERTVAEREQHQSARVRSEHARLSEVPPEQLSPEENRTFDIVELLVSELRKIERPQHANTSLQAEIEDTLSWLRERIAGKICLIGYTATSLADMKPIPISNNAPGVTAHANLLNGLLTGQLVRWAPASINVALATILGIGACMVSVSRPPRVALVIIALAAIAYVGLAGWLAFYRWTYWIHLTPTLGTMLLSFVAIAVYRYFFVDLERRQLSTALGQYTSKSIAEQVADDPELCRRAEMREVSTMFTDLKGFTTISENIGAERTQNLLNACLGRFTEVMLDHEAMVNKFIGDGIFAFWNPVIYSQPDHARLACETAIDLLTALSELIDEQRQRGGDEAFGELVLRIGVATGNAIVGPCGSEQKFDYTCIGDSVNVAARLESANKFYGTQILVSDATCQQVADRFAFRPLGGVQVKGKREAVQIAELLGRTGQVDGETLAYAQAFGQAVALFQKRDWAGAREAFEASSIQQPDDLAARHYAEAAKVYLERPPDDDWNGAIELAEK